MLNLVSVLRCPACGALDPGPRLLCPCCFSPGLVPHDVPGDGVLASWTVIRRPPVQFRGDGPYAVAVVDLSVGVRVTGRLSAIPKTMSPGTKVTAVGQAQQAILFKERSSVAAGVDC